MRVRPVLLPALLLAVLSLGAAPRPALAKSEKPAAAGAPAEPEELKRFRAVVPKLGLSAEQKQKVDRLIAETKAAIQKIAASTGTPEDKKTRWKGLHEKARAGLDNILTVAQNEKLKKLMNDAGPAKSNAKGGK